MARSNPYALGLDRNAANHVPLSPLSFIERAALVYPQRRAIVYGDRSQDWRATHTRCRRLASALARRCAGAVPEGDYYRVSGSKIFITEASTTWPRTSSISCSRGCPTCETACLGTAGRLE